MHLGFMGTGVITKAVVTGLVRSGISFDRIALSPRNSETAAELAALDARVAASTAPDDRRDRESQHQGVVGRVGVKKRISASASRRGLSGD
jgi:pyrroline-5-carboxylate reductase